MPKVDLTPGFTISEKELVERSVLMSKELEAARKVIERARFVSFLEYPGILESLKEYDEVTK